MNIFGALDPKGWIEQNQHLFAPPARTNQVIAQQGEFIVMMLHGPNARLDFHVQPGDEFFCQVKGDIELHLKPEGERRQVVTIREGEIFLCPGGLAHSPRRSAGSWGLVIERKRKSEETEAFAWFCESCDEKVLWRTVRQGEVAVQVRRIYEEFNADPALRSCRQCGYRFSAAPIAERLGFLDPR
jgi:3-hydroxyanthranilate 3,4-dioxygenase